MIRIAIVEDDETYIAVLKEYLTRYEQEFQIRFHIRTYSDGLDIISDYSADYDIILLDIQMKHMNGMTAAEKIRLLDENVAFIFITSTVQFAVQGYLVDALGYVLKPVPYLAFSQILSKAVKQTQQRRIIEYMTIDVEGGSLRLELSQIYYLESQKHHIIVHTKKGRYLTGGPMKKAENQLTPKGFSKCHNAYLVNLAHVTGVLQNNAVLTDSTQLPISRTRKKSFMTSLTNYLGGI